MFILVLLFGPHGECCGACAVDLGRFTLPSEKSVYISSCPNVSTMPTSAKY